MLDPRSIIALPMENGLPVFPSIDRSPADPFIRKVEASGKKWVIFTDLSGEPKLLCNSDEYLRAAFFEGDDFDPYRYCHRPIVVKDENMSLGHVIPRLRVYPERADDDVIDYDVILLWTDHKRVITGADILGRLLRGIALTDGRSDETHPSR